MAVVYTGQVDTGYGSAGGVNITLTNVTPSAGDLLVLFVQARAAAPDWSVYTGAGWGQAVVSNPGDATFSIYAGIFYKISDGTETGINVDHGSSYATSAIARFTGAATSSVLDATDYRNDYATLGSENVSAPAGSAANTVADGLAVAMATYYDGRSVNAGGTPTLSSGWTEIVSGWVSGAPTAAPWDEFAYQIYSALSTYTFEATSNESPEANAGAIALFKAASGGSPTLAANSWSYTLTGNAAALLAQRVLTAETGSFTLTGNAANLAKTTLLSAESGTFTLTGNTVDLLARRAISAEAGSYTLTGNTVDLTYTANTPTLTAEAASFTLAGNDVGLFANRVLSADTGTFTFTGNEAVLSRVSLLTAESGTFTFTGNAANLLAARTITAESGSYTLTGGEANLSRQLVLSAETGNYTYTGNDAALYKVYLLSAATGEFQLTGNNVELLLSRKLLAEAGTFVFTGNNATLTKTGGSGDAAAIWNYIFSNGLTAEDTLVAINEKLSAQGGILTVGKFLGLK